jgi:hypothetical protein
MGLRRGACEPTAESESAARPIRARRRMALLGILAVLLQAILFGWHHHPLALSAAGGQPVASLHAAPQPAAPEADETDCEICAALHHVSASPLDFAALPLPPRAASAIDPPDRVLLDRTAARAFCARAPPRA